jgi:threonine dehydrogenase-like Zn-dependent dehydrogenase
VGSSQALRLRTLEVGVCGTDREILAFTHGTPPAGSDFLVIGHEALLQVVEPAQSSESREPLRAGELAVPMVRRPCMRPECRPCRSGRADFCRSGEYRERGITRAHGFLAEESVEEERWLVPVPAALAHVAVLTEPLSIAEKALDQAAAVQARLPWGCPEPGRCLALVLGAGAIGLLGALKLRTQGFAVVVYSRGPADGTRARWVRELGARYVSAEEMDADALAASCGEADLVYEATGAAPLAFAVLERSLATNGVFLFTGIPGRRSPAELPVSRLMSDFVLRNQVVLGSVNAARRHYEGAVRDLAVFEARFPGLLPRLLARRVALEHWREAFAWSPEDVKNVVQVAEAR